MKEIVRKSFEAYGFKHGDIIKCVGSDSQHYQVGDTFEVSAKKDCVLTIFTEAGINYGRLGDWVKVNSKMETEVA